MDPVFEARLLSYLKIMGKHIGLLINFNTRLLKDGIKRLALEGTQCLRVSVAKN